MNRIGVDYKIYLIRLLQNIYLHLTTNASAIFSNDTFQLVWMTSSFDLGMQQAASHRARPHLLRWGVSGGVRGSQGVSWGVRGCQGVSGDTEI